MREKKKKKKISKPAIIVSEKKLKHPLSLILE